MRKVNEKTCCGQEKTPLPVGAVVINAFYFFKKLISLQPLYNAY